MSLSEASAGAPLRQRQDRPAASPSQAPDFQLLFRNPAVLRMLKDNDGKREEANGGSGRSLRIQPKTPHCPLPSALLDKTPGLRVVRSLNSLEQARTELKLTPGFLVRNAPKSRCVVDRVGPNVRSASSSLTRGGTGTPAGPANTASQSVEAMDSISFVFITNTTTSSPACSARAFFGHGERVQVMQH
jgi:hypothetical protein